MSSGQINLKGHLITIVSYLWFLFFFLLSLTNNFKHPSYFNGHLNFMLLGRLLVQFKAIQRWCPLHSTTVDRALVKVAPRTSLAIFFSMFPGDGSFDMEEDPNEGTCSVGV